MLLRNESTKLNYTQRVATTSILCLFWLFSLSLGRAAYALSTPVITSGTETAQPGDIVNVLGSNFSSTCTANVRVNGGFPISGVTVLKASNNIVQVSIPYTAPSGLFSVQIANPDGGSTPNPLIINSPRIVSCETPQFAPGGTFRVWGKNIIKPGGSASTTTVRFVPSGGGSGLSGTVTAATNYVLTISAPATALTGTAYNLYVNNGLTESIAPFTLTCIGSTQDPFNLGVPWASDFAGLAAHTYQATDTTTFAGLPALTSDGSGDNRSAIQGRLYKVSSLGGGILHLAAGTYYVDTSTQFMEWYSNVVLQGDGPGQTIIKYGPNAHIAHPSIYPSSYRWVLRLWSTMGVMNLSFVNANPYSDADLVADTNQMVYDSPGLYNNTFCAQTGAISDVFFKNVDFNIGYSGYASMQTVNKFSMTNCTFEDTSHTDNAVYFLGNTNARYANNTFNYQAGRIHLRQNQNSVWEGNTINRTSDQPIPGFKVYNSQHVLVQYPPYESGGLECSYSPGLLVQNSSFNVNQRYTDNNDGETILTQTVPGTGPGTYLDAGTATSVTATTLTDVNKNWALATQFNTSTSGVGRSVLVITSGNGIGQWRYITGVAATTLTVDHAWTVTPDSNCNYAITVWSGDQLYALNNTLNNNPRGIELYNGGNSCVIDGNTLIDSENIAADSWCIGGQTPSATSGNVLATVAVNNLIRGNTLSNPSKVNYAMCGVYSETDYVPLAYGSSNIANEVRFNEIKSYVPTTQTLGQVQALPDAVKDGFWNDMHIFEVGSAPNYTGSVVGATTGTIFQGNYMIEGDPLNPHYGNALPAYFVTPNPSPSTFIQWVDPSS